MRLRNLGLAAAGLLMLAFTSLAQITTIEGDVKGLDGKPAVGAVITLHRTDMKWDSKTKTDKKGHYFHAGLPYGGIFTISVEIDGKVMDSMKGVRTSGTMDPVNFDLSKSMAANAAKQADVQKAIETGQLTKEQERSLSAEEKAALQKQIEQQASTMKKHNELNAAFNEGRTALEAKQWDAAVTALTKASELDAKQPAVWANLGDAYVGVAGTKTGPDFDANMQKGLDAYNKAIELKPDDASTHNNYALALAKAKKFPEMQDELKKAATLDPASAYQKYYNLGALLTNAGQNDAAAEAFKMAIDSAPNDPRNAAAYFRYGTALLGKVTELDANGKMKTLPGTAESFQKYLELAPNGPDAQACKDTLAALGSGVETKFEDPNAKAKAKTKKK